ncbi:hypothetical protein R83H12_02271 [Fibrobacteria bacterium R8-3-H12]
MRSILTKITHILTILLIGGIGVQTIISCSGGDDGGGGGSSSQSGGKCNDINVGNYGNKGNGIANYKTVQIGDQLWMAENLNYAVPGGKCYGEGSEVLVYDGDNYVYKTLSKAEIQANCDKYGRLYDWATAMALPSDCNLYTCSDQIGANHRGICPSGWHIPSSAEWSALLQYVRIDQNCSALSLCEANHLMATSGWWDDFTGKSHNGEDTYGFSALPGGLGGNCEFDMAGSGGDWWSASEDGANGNYAGGARTWQIMSSVATSYIKHKIYLGSVRCLRDDSGNSSSSVVPSSSSEYTGGSCDASDYGTVEIGTQTWMAKNWGCYVPGSRCYNNDPANCAKYGRLYDWVTAMALTGCDSTSCASQIGAKHRGICPSGWHIPSHEEWSALTTYVGGSSTAGTKLKAVSGWNNKKDGSSGNGEDTYGFSALPGGGGDSFVGVGDLGFWWSASERSDSDKYAYVRYMSYLNESVSSNYEKKIHELLSVRCLQD